MGCTRVETCWISKLTMNFPKLVDYHKYNSESHMKLGLGGSRRFLWVFSIARPRKTSMAITDASW